MRKILLVLALLASILAVPLTSPPAAHAVTCGDYKWRKTFQYNWSPDVGPGSDAEYLYSGKAWFQFCTNADGKFAKVHEYHVLIDKISGTCDNLDEWHINPNVLNWWNPGTKSVNCQSVTDTVFKPDSASGSVNVFPNAPRNEQCIGADITAGIVRATDQTRSLKSICWYPEGDENYTEPY